LGFAFVPEFLAATSLLEPTKVCRTESKRFLTIFEVRVRTKSLCNHIEFLAYKNTIREKKNREAF
jgi:hypothetical protein